MKFFRITFLPLLFFCSCLYSQPSNANQFLNSIQYGIDLTINQNYDKAFILFDSLKKAEPENPAGYFFTAAAWQAKMMDFETLRWREKFYAEIELTLKIAQASCEENPNDMDACFFHAAALSYKSFQQARDNKYFSAIKIAIKSIKELEDITKKDSSFCDPYLGVGSYKFWRSHITRNFKWLPFFSDQRKDGINMLKTVQDCSRYSKWAAISNLAWIYIEQNQYKEAITAASTGLKFFPESRFFLWPYADACLLDEQFDMAIISYIKILKSVQAETVNNHYNETVLYYKLAQCYFALGDKNTALDYCKKTIEQQVDEEVKARAKEKREQAAELISEINRN